MKSLAPSSAAVERCVSAALAEDLGPRGDLTTDALIDEQATGTAHLVARSDLVLAGLPVARAVFAQLHPEAALEGIADEGQRVPAFGRIATVRGPLRAILAGERTALNFLMRLSGIAGAARAAVAEVAGTGVGILDTRKTAPGLRELDKYAVATGGAQNHRHGLYDAVMIKDTHLAAAGSISDAVARVLARGHEPGLVTVEVRTPEQLKQAIDAGAGRALLDNMDLATLRRSVEIGRGRIVLEASGGARPGKLRAIAETGVDFISIGWLTHSAPAADLAMEMENAF